MRKRGVKIDHPSDRVPVRATAAAAAAGVHPMGKQRSGRASARGPFLQNTGPAPTAAPGLGVEEGLVTFVIGGEEDGHTDAAASHGLALPRLPPSHRQRSCAQP